MSIPGSGFRMESEKDFAVYNCLPLREVPPRPVMRPFPFPRRERMSPSQTAASH